MGHPCISAVASPRHAAMRRRSPPVVSRTITEESISRIIELVQLDAALVAEKMQQQGATAAWKLAKISYERRWPLIEWTLRFQFDRARLGLVEIGTNCTTIRDVTPPLYAELEWQRSHLAARLDEQRSRLVMALIALRPALSQRLLEAASDRPSLIPSIGKRVLASWKHWMGWRSNVWLRRFRTPERFEATRATIIEKWLQVRCAVLLTAQACCLLAAYCTSEHFGAPACARRPFSRSMIVLLSQSARRALVPGTRARIPPQLTL
jgi:hypothetical protein